MIVTGWPARREREVVAYLIAENRRLRLTDDDRRRLAARAYRVGRRALRDIATIATPDTLLRWRRQLIARKWTCSRPSVHRRQVMAEIRRLVIRMAEENATWGYTRMQGALRTWVTAWGDRRFGASSRRPVSHPYPSGRPPGRRFSRHTGA